MNNLLLTKKELEILTDIIGQDLTVVRYDRWSAQLSIENTSISIEPDEISVPTLKNPSGDIVTLRIKLMTIDDKHIIDNTELTNCGKIIEIIRLESLVEIEDPRQVQSTTVLNVEIPAGIGWNNNIYSPSKESANSNTFRTLLGLQFSTDKSFTFTFFTDAVAYFVQYYLGQGLPSELKGKCDKIKINTT